jgi:hypothetical protein
MQLTINLRSYIADPYWPERERLINIQKESGMNRARSSANRRKALEEHLRANDMTLADYERLEVLASRPFHTDDDGRIVIPSRQVTAMIVATCDEARAAFRPCPPEQVRYAIRASSWTTDVTPDDALVWERYAMVTAGTGARLSNQRALRRNAYIGAEPPDETLAATKPVTARGTVEVDPEMVKPDVLLNALTWAGQRIGIGACRKMGWGRFEVLAE